MQQFHERVLVKPLEAIITRSDLFHNSYSWMISNQLTINLFITFHKALCT